MRKTLIGVGLATVLLAGCGVPDATLEMPAGTAPMAMASRARSSAISGNSAGGPQHSLYGAVVQACITAIGGSGQLLLLSALPSSHYQGHFWVTATALGEPLPELRVGEDIQIFVDYPLIEGNTIVAESQPYEAFEVTG